MYVNKKYKISFYFHEKQQQILWKHVWFISTNQLICSTSYSYVTWALYLLVYVFQYSQKIEKVTSLELIEKIEKII